jgi:hypothetical protein
MTDDTILSHAEALAEITRLREHIALLEATLVHRHGTWISSVPAPPDEPASFTGNLPPNAPPHGSTDR